MSRCPMPRRHGGRPWAVAYAVRFCRPHAGGWYTDPYSPPAVGVFGVGRSGARTAKRVARALAADPTHLARLPPDRVDGQPRMPQPGRTWWVVQDRDDGWEPPPGPA